jgi:hypothetical protein
MTLWNAGGAGAAAGGEEAAVDPAAVNYDAPTNARAGTSETGAEVEEATEEKTTEAAEGETATEEGAKPAKRTLVGDLQAERGKRQTAEAALAERDALIQSWTPILRKLDGRPDLQQAVLDGTVTVAQAERTKEREDRAQLEDLAQDFGWYETDGTTPDLKRAEKHLALIRREAAKIAGTEVAPVRQQIANREAATRVDQAVAYCIEKGHADPDFVRAELTKIARTNPEHLLDNARGNGLYEMIIGKASMQGKVFKGKAPAKGKTETTEERETAFVHTESSGSKGSGPKLTSAEKQLGEQYGITEKDWQRAEAHSGVRRGYSRLTDD